MRATHGRPLLLPALCLFALHAARAESADKMYWTDMGTAAIRRANLDGSGAADLIASGLSSPAGIALDVSAGKMVWSDTGTDKIQRADLDGSDVEDLVTSGLDTAYGLALNVSGGKMVWCDWGAGKIQRANLDGTLPEELITGLEGAGLDGIDLDLAAGKMYWAEVMTRKIRRADLDGSDVEDLVTLGAGSSPAWVALDAGAAKMYWTDYTGGKIQRAGLDGSGAEELIATGLVNPAAIALDTGAGKMYWTDQGTAKIQRANLDGSGAEDLITLASGLPGVIAICKDPAWVELVSLSAVVLPMQVLISWETASELDSAGFHVWRCHGDPCGAGDWVRVTVSLIPARGSLVEGAAYTFPDAYAPEPREGLLYRLEEVDTAGGSTSYGPVEAVAGPQAWTVPPAATAPRGPAADRVSGPARMLLLLLPALFLRVWRRARPGRS